MIVLVSDETIEFNFASPDELSAELRDWAMVEDVSDETVPSI